MVELPKNLLVSNLYIKIHGNENNNVFAQVKMLLYQLFLYLMQQLFLGYYFDISESEKVKMKFHLVFLITFASRQGL